MVCYIIHILIFRFMLHVTFYIQLFEYVLLNNVVYFYEQFVSILEAITSSLLLPLGNFSIAQNDRCYNVKFKKVHLQITSLCLFHLRLKFPVHENNSNLLIRPSPVEQYSSYW